MGKILLESEKKMSSSYFLLSEKPQHLYWTISRYIFSLMLIILVSNEINIII